MKFSFGPKDERITRLQGVRSRRIQADLRNRSMGHVIPPWPVGRPLDASRGQLPSEYPQLEGGGPKLLLSGVAKGILQPTGCQGKFACRKRQGFQDSQRSLIQFWLVDDDGEPHLMDFGLAKRKETEVTITTDGAILGTPAYMSPEQARGEASHVDGRSDIYSLGVIFFNC